MPESVNRRGSSGPTIGAIVRCSGVVAMLGGYLRRPGPRPGRDPDQSLADDWQWTVEAARRSRTMPLSGSEHLRQEGPGPFLAGVDQHLLGRASLDHQALVHEHDLVSDLTGEPHLVRDDDHRHPVPRQLTHDVEYL